MSSRRTNSVIFRTRLLLALYIGVGAFLLAHSVNAVVADSLARPVHQTKAEEPAGPPESEPHSRQKMSQQLVQDILSSGLFPLPSAPKDNTSDKSVTAPAAPPLDVAKKVALVGIVMGVTGNERAILEDLSNKKQTLYQVSRRIPDVGTLVAIEKDRVLFREGSQEEWLELSIIKQGAAIMPFPQLSQLPAEAAQPLLMRANPSSRRILDRVQLIQLISNPQAYLTEARFQPHFSGNGQLDGFRIDGIRQVGVLEKAGLQNDDVLAGVNGVEIRDPARLWDVFKQLQHERTVRFNVVRQSQPITLAVEIRG